MTPTDTPAPMVDEREGLLPCPFCGSADIEQDRWGVRCRECKAEARAMGIEADQTMWNRRASAPAEALLDEQAGRHADLGRLMQATGVLNDGRASPAVLFQRCLDRIASAPGDGGLAPPAARVEGLEALSKTVSTMLYIQRQHLRLAQNHKQPLNWIQHGIDLLELVEVALNSALTPKEDA